MKSTDDELKKIAARLSTLAKVPPEGRVVLLTEIHGGALASVDFFIDGEELEDSGAICNTQKEALAYVKEGPCNHKREWAAAEKRAKRRDLK